MLPKSFTNVSTIGLASAVLMFGVALLPCATQALSKEASCVLLSVGVLVLYNLYFFKALKVLERFSVRNTIYAVLGTALVYLLSFAVLFALCRSANRLMEWHTYLGN